MSQNLKTALRMCPINREEFKTGGDVVVARIEDRPNHILVAKRFPFDFDHVFGKTTEEATIYAKTTANLVDKLFNGMI